MAMHVKTLHVCLRNVLNSNRFHYIKQDIPTESGVTNNNKGIDYEM